MAARDLVVVGGSAGALQALIRCLESLPPRIDVTILVAIHRSPELPGALPDVLARYSPLPVAYGINDEPLIRGRVYLAPPDHHLLVSGESLRVTRGPREHGVRPAVDPLFRTAAREHGQRVVGVILSGMLDDGVQGLALVKRHGGVAIVQRPEDAEYDGMPANALGQVDVDHVLPAARVGPLLARLATEIVRGGAPPHDADVAELGGCALRSGGHDGTLQPFVCPECGGAIWERRPGESVRYECHVGHAFTARTLMALQDGQLEQALWTALRNLEEHAALRRRLAARARGGGLSALADGYDGDAQRSEERADVLRRILIEPDSRSPAAAAASGGGAGPAVEASLGQPDETVM